MTRTSVFHLVSRTPTLVVLALAAGLCGLPAPVRGQSALERVEELTRMGRSEEARASLMDWWTNESADAPRPDLQRALWLRGRLTVDPLQAELDFRRLAVLYPSGQFTADAIFRLAQASFAMGDEETARTYVATLVRDYPRTQAREAAEAWLAGAGPVPAPGDTPTRVAPDRRATEVRAAPRTTGGEPGAGGRPPAGQPERAAPPEDDEPETSAGEPVMNYYVQLGAFTEPERAFTLAEEVAERGVEVRVVRVEGSRFTHVRVGRFAQRQAAVELLDELTAQGINAALVRDDRPETVIRN